MARGKQSEAVRPFWRHPTFAWIVGFVMGVSGAAFTYIMNASLVVAFPFAALSIAVNTVLMAALVCLVVGGVLHAMQWAYDRYTAAPTRPLSDNKNPDTSEQKNPDTSEQNKDIQQVQEPVVTQTLSDNKNPDTSEQNKDIKQVQEPVVTQILLVSHDGEDNTKGAGPWSVSGSDKILGDNMHVIVPNRSDISDDDKKSWLSSKVISGLEDAMINVPSNSTVQFNTIYCGTGIEYKDVFSNVINDKKKYQEKLNGCKVHKRCILFEVDIHGGLNQESQRKKGLHYWFEDNSDTEFVFVISQDTIERAKNAKNDNSGEGGKYLGWYNTFLAVVSLIQENDYANVKCVITSGEVTHENYLKPPPRSGTSGRQPVINVPMMNHLLKDSLFRMPSEITAYYDQNSTGTLLRSGYRSMSTVLGEINNDIVSNNNNVENDETVEDENDLSEFKDNVGEVERTQTKKKTITLVSHGNSVTGEPWRTASQEKKLGSMDVIAPDWKGRNTNDFMQSIKSQLNKAMSQVTDDQEVEFNIVCCSEGGWKLNNLVDEVCRRAQGRNNVRVRIISCEASFPQGVHRNSEETKKAWQLFLSQWKSLHKNIELELVFTMSESTLCEDNTQYKNPYTVYRAAEEMQKQYPNMKCVKIAGCASHANYLVSGHDVKNRKTVLNTAMMSHLLYTPLKEICNKIEAPRTSNENHLCNSSKIYKFDGKPMQSQSRLLGKEIQEQSIQVNSQKTSSRVQSSSLQSSSVCTSSPNKKENTDVIMNQTTDPTTPTTTTTR